MSNISNSILQNLPHFKGKLRLAKLLYKSKIAKKEEVDFYLKKTNLKITLPNLIENVSFELFINGEYEQEIVDFFVKELPPNGVFFDIGANIGAFSFTLAKLRPDITIYAFEAAPFVFNYLKKNIEQNNLKNVVYLNRAIHTEDNTSLPFYSSKEKNGKGSFSNVFTNEAVYVSTLNLDKFIAENNIKPNVIKVDVEGYEKLIFQSMQNFLKSNNDVSILFEFVDWAENLAHNHKAGDAQILIKQMGYKLFEMKNNEFVNKDTIQTTGVCKTLLAKK